MNTTGIMTSTLTAFDGITQQPAGNDGRKRMRTAMIHCPTCGLTPALADGRCSDCSGAAEGEASQRLPPWKPTPHYVPTERPQMGFQPRAATIPAWKAPRPVRRAAS